MEIVSPGVYLIAYTHLDSVAVEQWLRRVGGLKALDHIDGDDGEKLVELSGRNCYRSFDVGINPNISKVRTNSQEYHANVLESAHGSVLEHATCTFAFEDISRVVTHELVRHRAGTAFCLSGDTLIYSERKYKGLRQGCKKRTIKSIFERTLTSHGRSRLKLLRLRCLDENSNTFSTTKVKQVCDSGTKHCFHVKLKDGKEIICSKDHQFLTHLGWQSLSDLVGGLSISVNNIAYYKNRDASVAVNGTKMQIDKERFFSAYYSMSNKQMADMFGVSLWKIRDLAQKYQLSKRVCFNESLAKNHLYKNKEWLRDEYHINKSSIREIANLCGTTEPVIRNWLKKYNLQSRRMPGSFVPWNKGCAYKNNRKLTEAERLSLSRRMTGEGNHRWKGGVTKLANKIRKSADARRRRIYIRDNFTCRKCNLKGRLTLHHIIPLWTDPVNFERLNVDENLITICQRCHFAINGKELDYVEMFQKLIHSNIAIGPIKKQPHGEYKYVPKFVGIKSIAYAGLLPTYDIETTGPNNFIANGIVVHNSQMSLRYVRLEDIRFWIPSVIADNAEACKIFNETVEKCEWAQKELARIFNINEIKDFNKKKQLTSAFRRVAPIGLATSIVVTFNVRALRWIIQMRTAESAEVEIRKVFCMVYNIAKEKYPFLFQDFETIDTGDGLFVASPRCNKV